ncbi:MAG: response regulator [Planctomycetales bacterium]|nr:response regulator [Planctomycetales bacterium]
MILQWCAGVVVASWLSPRTWAGVYSEPHVHVWAATLLGGLISFLPVFLASTCAGTKLTRHVIAISQMLTSALLIHLSGGRIETHFHVFGSLAVLACYRDWRVLVSATVVVSADHFVRGVFYPQTVFGVLSASPWRVCEHAAWVVFENAFLTVAINQSVGEMKAIARQRAELEGSHDGLVESGERYQAIFGEMVDAVVVTDDFGIVEQFNPAAEKMFGYAADEAIGQNVSMLMPSQYREEHDGYMQRYRRTGIRHILGEGREAVGKRKNGSTFPIHLTLSEVLLKSSSAGVERKRLFIGIVRDLSTVKEIAELKQAKADLIIAKEAAEAASRSKSEFLANMSHEIRTPMTAILGFTDILSQTATKLEDVDAISTIQKNGKHLISLINDILDLSKIEAGKLETECIICSPVKIVEEVTSLMRVRATAKGLPLNVRYDGLLPETICSDPTRLRQVLTNVLGNAIKFTESGSVDIVTRLLNEPGMKPQLEFDIIDTGIGITPENIQKLFRPFTQADSSMTRTFGGSGLGLAICKRLVEGLGGDISVSSEIGTGSTFSLRIATGSLADVQLMEAPIERPSISNCDDVQVTSEASPSLRGIRVLLAEDGFDNQRLIGFVLRKAGAEVAVTENGQIAYDLAMDATTDNQPYGIILMDMQMPVMNGYETTAKLREAGYTGPIVALTAHAMAEERQKCLDAGCNDYITKPIEQKKLIALVKEVALEAASV